ncbi:MAG: family 10 glycosylhydrolase [Ignavibacterium sp.]|nr:family 10 glycosylhydrolase [Ignavibacterium sp.]
MNLLTGMKYLISALTILLITNLNAQQNNQEFRATWVITWEYINSGSSVEVNKARIREILDNHKKANMTSVLFQIRQSGTAYYQSSYEPWGYYAGYTYPGFDPLEYAIEEAHKRGLELHAWFNTFSVSSSQPGTIPVEHPDWICRDQNGNPMTSYKAASPGMQAVRDYTINVAMEIVRNYDIDGLHLDYVRWNEYDIDDMLNPSSQIEQEKKTDGIFSDITIKKLTSPESTNRFLYDVEHPYSAGVPSGFNTWEEWWRWSVTEFVQTLHDSIQAVKPWVRLSPAALGNYKSGGASGWNGYYVVYQDAALWFNQGYVEQLTPMHYHWLTGNDLFNAITSDWEPNIQQGIQAGRLYTCGPGSYRLDENNVWSNHIGIVNRMRDKEWVDGFQFFSYGSWNGYDYWDEAGSTFFNKKVKVRDINLVSQPDAPSISLNRIDSLQYEIFVTPASTTNNYWFAVYRSEDDTLNIDDDAIVDMHFSNSQYSFIDSYSGLQNFNGTYTYFATALNRYWNESEISNSVTTELIPSFAPIVVSTYPSENGILNTSNNIRIEFSKTMDANSFTDAITITPSVQINNLIWDGNHKILSIAASGHQYQTSYTLVIDSTVSDINGRMIDGNNDGIEGDPFVLNYQTNEEDLTGPQIIYSYPSNNDTSIDVGSILTIVFDEKIDPQTFSVDDITLSDGISPVSFNFQHTNSEEGKSIICVQPLNLFNRTANYSITISSDIADTLGNISGTDTQVNFATSGLSYSEIKMIDNFTTPGDWKQPDYSGSTKGILASGTHFEFTNLVYLPATNPKKSAKLTYLWDANASDFLIREYLAGGTPQSIYFDTSYVLQSYVYGDGSNTRFRFCIDEYTGTAWGDHEVSKWITINWHGWKLVEWKLNDPNSVGIWIGDGNLTGQYFRIDSYQLTRTSESSISGVIYFDDLRAVKKINGPTDMDDYYYTIPEQYFLSQNYPNPFNPETIIKYQIPSAGRTTLKIFDLLGNEVATIVDEFQSTGRYEKKFNGSALSSGIYFYRLQSDSFVETKKMVLLK